MVEVLPLSELELMDHEEKVATLQKYRASYTIKDLSQAWGLSNPIQYYMWLKKQQIYEQLVRRADKFEPTKEWKRIKETEGRDSDRSSSVKSVPADQFRYGLDTESTGPELSHVFRRLADFLANESGHFRCRVELKALPQQAAPSGDWKEEEPGA